MHGLSMGSRNTHTSKHFYESVAVRCTSGAQHLLFESTERSRRRGMRVLGPKVSRYAFTKHDTAEDMVRAVMAKLDELDILQDEEDRKTMCTWIVHDLPSIYGVVSDGISPTPTRVLRLRWPVFIHGLLSVVGFDSDGVSQPLFESVPKSWLVHGGLYFLSPTNIYLDSSISSLTLDPSTTSTTSFPSPSAPS